MRELTSTQAKYLRGMAHGLKPVVFIGQKGFTDALIRSTEEAFESHELIKAKFIDYKGKKQRTEIANAIAARTGSHLAEGDQQIGVLGPAGGHVTTKQAPPGPGQSAGWTIAAGAPPQGAEHRPVIGRQCRQDAEDGQYGEPEPHLAVQRSDWRSGTSSGWRPGR